MNFPDTLLSENAKKTLAVVVNAFFVMGSYCTPVSQIEAETEWMQAALHICFLTLARQKAPWGFCNASNGP